MIDSMFPLSIFMLLAGFLAGSIGAFLVFGAKTIILMTILMWLGMFRILPLVQAIERIIHDLFPAEVEQLENNIRESFRVEGTVDKEPAIYLFHPHGLFSMSHTLHIMTSLTNWPVREIKGAGLDFLFILPICNEITKEIDCVPAKYKEMKTVLTHNKSLSVVAGGIEEIFEAKPGRMRLAISRRRGIFKMALETGTALVPVLTYGENELYQPVDWGWLDSLNRRLIPLGFCFPIPTLDSCRRWMRLTDKPFKTPLRTVIGPRLAVEKVAGPVREAAVVALRERYFTAVRELYAKTRPLDYAEELEIL